MMPVNRHACALVILSLALSSCDIIYGVNRQTAIPAAPDFTCVERVIRQAPGVDDVRYLQTEGSRPLTWTGIKPATDIHAFLYRDGQVSGVLQVSIEYDGETEFSQSHLDINRKPPQELIDATRPVMLWIEQQLESQCGMVGLTAAIKEECSGVECPVVHAPNKALQRTRTLEPSGQREPAGSGPRG